MGRARGFGGFRNGLAVLVVAGAVAGGVVIGANVIDEPLPIFGLIQMADRV